jgi:hypothetical protein
MRNEERDQALRRAIERYQAGRVADAEPRCLIVFGFFSL